MAIKAQTAIPYFNNSVSVDSNGTTYTQKYRVPFSGTDSASDRDFQLLEALALNASGLPKYGDSFRGNNSAYCERISVSVISGQENNKPTNAIVTCIFSTKPVENRDEESDPLNKRPDISWNIVFEREVVLNCYRIQTFQNGQRFGQVIRGQVVPNAERAFRNVNLFNLGITNSAKRPFNPQPEADVPYLSCTITQNLPTFDPTLAIGFTGTVNRFPFQLDGEKVNPGQALCLGRTADIKYSGKVSYREVKTQLLFKETHALIVQDKGFDAFKQQSNVFGGPQGAVLETLKQDGQDISDEELLDGRGNVLGKGQNQKPVYIHFDYLKPTDFRLLNLPEERL